MLPSRNRVLTSTIGRLRRALPRTMTLVLPAFLLSDSGWAATGAPCERFALHELSPGMSYEMVRVNMGGEGVTTLIRIPGSGETSAVDYPGPSSNVYVQYDHRIDRRPSARAVLVRTSLALSPTNVQALLNRLGPPLDGAYDLGEGLHDGAAVWVDEKCGVVLTAYRPQASWWAVDGGAILQVETLDLARRDGSPASTRLNGILEHDNEPVPAISEAAPTPPAPPLEPAPVPVPVPEAVGPTLGETFPHEVDPPAVPVVAPPPLPAHKAPAIASPHAILREAAPAAPQTIATWRSPARAEKTLPPGPTANVPTAPQSIAMWHSPDPASSAPPAGPTQPITFVPPVYPPTARWLGVKGHVTLAIVVRPDGAVAAPPRVVAALPTGRGFEEAAVEAVSKWRFNPAVREGRPVESSITVGVDFDE